MKFRRRLASLVLISSCGLAQEVPPEVAADSDLLPPPPAEDPWAAWGSITPPGSSQVALDLPRAEFVLPPAANLFPQRALEVPLYRIRSVHFEGNRRFGSAELAALVPSLTQQPVDLENLDMARDAITRHYIDAGLVSSGARVKALNAKDGSLVFTVTEGALTDVELNGNRRVRDRYIISRVKGAPGETLHFPTLQHRLQILQMNPNLPRIQAELRPGSVPGESYLDLAVEEKSTWSYGLDLHNHLPPSVGSEQLDLWLQSRNLTGWCDSLDFRYGVFAGGASDTEWSGLDSLQGSYLLPFNRYDTSLQVLGERQGYAVIEEPFAELAIDGESWSAGAGLWQPLLRTLEDEVAFSLTLVKKHAETELLGVPFSVSPGFVNGELDLTTLRAGIDWTHRSADSVLFLGARAVLGLDAMGATESLSPADSSFFVWGASAQYLKRLNRHDHKLAIRASFQWADDSLPSPEQFSLGGVETVRGYRQNELVRDTGGSLGIEYHIPLADTDRFNLTGIVFADYGWAKDRADRGAEHLASAGIGFAATYRDWLRGEIFWGIPFQEEFGHEGNLQDHGIHFRLSAGRF